jgi:hypothetical protein
MHDCNDDHLRSRRVCSVNDAKWKAMESASPICSVKRLPCIGMFLRLTNDRRDHRDALLLKRLITSPTGFARDFPARKPRPGGGPR